MDLQKNLPLISYSFQTFEEQILEMDVVNGASCHIGESVTEAFISVTLRF